MVFAIAIESLGLNNRFISNLAKFDRNKYRDNITCSENKDKVHGHKISKFHFNKNLRRFNFLFR